tara:strand:+ start:294 stop:692 length:399 start_codon:yes stop_codon:yes gene_type:complete
MIKAKHIKGVNSNGYVLTTNGSGVVSWAAASGGGSRPVVTAISNNDDYNIANVTDSSVLEQIFLANTGSATITLPTAAGVGGLKIQIKNMITSAITIDTVSSQTIDTASSVSITSQYESLTFVSDNSNWVII